MNRSPMSKNVECKGGVIKFQPMKIDSAGKNETQGMAFRDQMQMTGIKDDT